MYPGHQGPGIRPARNAIPLPSGFSPALPFGPLNYHNTDTVRDCAMENKIRCAEVLS
jgi:hypothetical protein